MKLTIGRIVHVYVDPRSNNGSEVAPAIITRVWGTGELSHEVPVVNVNWRLFLDHSSNDPATNEWRTSTQVFIDQASADVALDNNARMTYPDADALAEGMVDPALAKRIDAVRQRKAAGAVGFMPAKV